MGKNNRYRQAGGHGRRRVGALDFLGAAGDIANVIREERRLRRIESELNKQRGGKLYPWQISPRQARRMLKQRGGLHPWQHNQIRKIAQRGGFNPWGNAFFPEKQRGGLNPWKARRMLKQRGGLRGGLRELWSFAQRGAPS